nr:uncharacterized protein LOC111774436 isoform X2 [Equus caballus]
MSPHLPRASPSEGSGWTSGRQAAGTLGNPGRGAAPRPLPAAPATPRPGVPGAGHFLLRRGCAPEPAGRGRGRTDQMGRSWATPGRLCLLAALGPRPGQAQPLAQRKPWLVGLGAALAFLFLLFVLALGHAICCSGSSDSMLGSPILAGFPPDDSSAKRGRLPRRDPRPETCLPRELWSLSPPPINPPANPVHWALHPFTHPLVCPSLPPAVRHPCLCVPPSLPPSIVHPSVHPVSILLSVHHPSLCPSIVHPSVCPSSIPLSVHHPSLCPSIVHPSVHHLSLCLSIPLSLHPPIIHPPTFPPFIHTSICPSVHPSTP